MFGCCKNVIGLIVTVLVLVVFVCYLLVDT